MTDPSPPPAPVPPREPGPLSRLGAACTAARGRRYLTTAILLAALPLLAGAFHMLNTRVAGNWMTYVTVAVVLAPLLGSASRGVTRRVGRLFLERDAKDLPAGCIVTGVFVPVLIWIAGDFDRVAVSVLQAGALTILAAERTYLIWRGPSRRLSQGVFYVTLGALVAFCWTFRPGLWSSDEDVDLGGPIGIAADHVAVFDREERLHVFAANGRVEVSPPLQCPLEVEQGVRRLPAERSAPAVAGDVACFAVGRSHPDEGALCAFGRTTGRLLWTRKTGGRHAPALHDGRAYFALAERDRPGAPARARVCAVDVADGREAWCSPLPGVPRSFAPLVAGDVLVVGAWNLGVVAFDRPSGAERWRLPRRNVPNQPLATAGGLVLVASGGYRLDAVDARSGQLRWSYRAPGEPRFAPSFADGHVAFGCACPEPPPGASGFGPPARPPDGRPRVDGCLIVLDAATGRERWRRRFHDETPSGVLAMGGVVYFEAGGLGALDLHSAARLWQSDESATPRAVLDGRLIAQDGQSISAWRLIWRPL